LYIGEKVIEDKNNNKESQIRKIGWLHFANDFSLDFITPLLPAGVGLAWIGIMEGLADGIGQFLKLFTGRASDKTGQRAKWVGAGYLVNAIARPLIAIGLLFSLPLWIVVCRILDRIGKGIRGSATDALIADWVEKDENYSALAFAKMRTMDHLGATFGALFASACAFFLSPSQLWIPVACMIFVTLWVAYLSKGLRDVPKTTEKEIGTFNWWPKSTEVRRPLLAIGIATIATKISPLIVLVYILAGSNNETISNEPLWLICLGWAAFGIIQAFASSFAGVITVKIGAAAMLRIGWLAGAIIFIGLGLFQGHLLLMMGLLFGILIGLTEGAEKTWLSSLVPSNQRATSFGAMSLITAATSLAGNALCGLLLSYWGHYAFVVMGVFCVLGVVFTFGNRFGRK
jgi:MFS family permease